MYPKFRWNFPYQSKRMPVLGENMVSTSHPLAAQAGLKMLLLGGNAVDAAVCTAITLTVVEPVNNGLGSDAFAIVWDGKKLHGLNASGKSPSHWTEEYFSQYKKMPFLGWDTVTIPGAVSAWVELWKKFGKLEFEQLFEPALNYARKGFLVPPIIADIWKNASRVYKKKRFPEFHRVFLPNGKSPKASELFKSPEQAKSLQKIAQTKGASFYNGELAEKIVEYAKETGGNILIKDLKNHKVLWQDPLHINYNGIRLHELPPNGQGLTALITLGILREFGLENYKKNSHESLHFQIEAMKLGFADAHRYISDPESLEIPPSGLLKEDYLKERANLIDLETAKSFRPGHPSDKSDTVYLTAADKNGMMVSYIQSNYFGFGSGIVIPNTGISLQNRGNCFTLEKGHPNQVGPNKRPYHTIIPAFVTKDGKPLVSFGVMGGAMQPQGHVQMIIRMFDYKENPQAAIDAPRWRYMSGMNISMENGFAKQTLEKLNKKGHHISKGHYLSFGGAQIICKLQNGYIAASETRKDGQVVAF
ncbi:MAG: Gamma-glutamyltransferase, gamma-glutamyltranspeptidase [Promethearchaeota archaeon]|nr:MAG: Gamma-glutamyltransferase, gamma-glutamyltranspeptidase [Candidatus Lokiarchaeota archaeon]